MWPMIGSLVSAGSSLLGGILGQNNQDKINEENIANQRDFAQHGLSWKVADAKAAGLNPLAALGAQTSSFSNVAGSDSLATGVQNMGQNLGRAVEHIGDEENKAFQTARNAQILQRGDLENQVLASQLRVNNQVGDPHLPRSSGNAIPGQLSSGPAARGAFLPGDAGNPAVKVVPDTVSAHDPANPVAAPGVSPAIRWVDNGGGYWWPSPSETLSSGSFDTHLGPWSFDWSHHVLPTMGYNMKPPFEAPPGQTWIRNLLRGYHLVPITYGSSYGTPQSPGPRAPDMSRWGYFGGG